MQEELENVLEKVNYSPTHAGKYSTCARTMNILRNMCRKISYVYIADNSKKEEHMQENFLHVSYKMEV